MERLLKFIYEYRAFFTFLLLELLCAWMIIRNNQYQGATYFNSSNRVAANLLAFSQGMREYFSLRVTNQKLAEENAVLRTLLEQREQRIAEQKIPALNDTLIEKRFEYISAKVIANSTQFYKNYITIDKGRNHGIRPGMAVLSAAGAVGKVKSVSDHYAVLISLLNTDDMVSATIKRTENFGTIQWEGTDIRLTNLRYIPRHASPRVGDTVITSGYNAVFPKGVMIGTIRECILKEDAPFWSIHVELSQDFSKLAFVSVIKSNLKKEKDSLELATFEEIR
jgi:rod shape-determining protein MreC